MSGADGTRRNMLRFALATGAVGVLLDSGEVRAAEPDPELFDFYVTKNAVQPGNGVPLVHWTAEPTSSEDGRAKFALVTSNVEFAGVKDPTMFLGYNAEAIIDEGLSDEPALVWGFEGLYRAESWSDTGVPEDTMEAYLEYRNANRSITSFRPYATTLGRGSDAARWATTHIDIGTDPSNSKSQFFVTGDETLFKVTNNVIAFSRRLQIEGQSAYFNSKPGGKNSHVLFLQNGKLRWYLGNFIGDVNHYLWDRTNDRRHVEYVAGDSDHAAMTRMHSQVHALGEATFASKAAFADDVTIDGGLAVQGDVSSAGALGIEGTGSIGGDLTAAADVKVGGVLDVVTDITVGGSAEVAGSLKVATDTVLEGSLAVTSGAAFDSDIAVGGGLAVADDVAVAGDTALAGKVGFNGAQPIGQRDAAPDATDLESALALINELKADLVALGLKATG